MTKKTFNSVTDFLEDPSFKNWAKNERLSDEKFWDFWLENNPDKKDLAYEAKDIVLGIKFSPKNIPSEKINIEWEKFASKIQKEPKRKSKSTYKWYGIAASIVFFLTVSFYFFSKPPYITHSTGYGETLNLKLQDGSIVKLNANSSISYPQNNTRKVYLKGEAYFEVDKKHTTNAKFWVTTEDLEVEVYGTVFNVNTNRKKTQVYLEEGNIWLALKNGDTKKMSPGNFISYSSRENKILEEKENISSNEKTSWKDGKLVFSNLPLEEAMLKVTETYGYKVIFKNEFNKTQLITGTVPTSNITICLKAIEKSVGVKIKKENTKLVVYKK